jgi:hypothetical protein
MIKFLSAFIAFVFLIYAIESAAAREIDHSTYGYCPDGTRVADIKKCNRSPDGSCKPGRHCKSLPNLEHQK